MTKQPKVFLTRRLPDSCMSDLESQCELTFNPDDRVLETHEIVNAVADVDGLLCLLTDKIDDQVFDAAPNLRAVSNYAVGFNNIDVEAATRRKIAVTNTPGVLTDATADMAFTLLMSAARRVVEGDQLVRTGQWGGWGPLQLLGGDVANQTLGLVGLGRIGRAMIKRGQGFSMDVVYWNRTRMSEQEEAELGVRYLSLDELLAESDFVSLHVALTDDTKHLIGADAFEAMKTTSILINTARGPVLDEAALVDAIKNAKIAGAGLDVYEREPIVEPELMKLDSVVLAPHLGSATTSTRTKMGDMAVADCLAICRGDQPKNLVNDEVCKAFGWG